MPPTRFLVGQILVVFAIVIGRLWLSTEWVAAAIGYAPTLFNEAGIMAASSGVAGIVVAVIGSLWRARQSRLATACGSSRWVSPPEVEVAGLFRATGVFLRRLKDRYPRHDRPEHILAFAVTRSGKGVGLVIPTLLSSTSYGVIHDIKRENWHLTTGWHTCSSHCLRYSSDNRTIRR